MNRARLDEDVRLLGIDLLAGAQQDGGSQFSPALREILPQRAPGIGSQAFDPPPETMPGRLLDHADAIWIRGPQPAKLAAPLQVRRLVEAPRVQIAMRSGKLPEHADAVAGLHAQQLPVDRQRRVTAYGDPVGAVTKGRGPHE